MHTVLKIFFTDDKLTKYLPEINLKGLPQGFQYAKPFTQELHTMMTHSKYLLTTMLTSI